MDSITHATSGTTGTKQKTFRSACITEHKKMPEWDLISAKIRYLAYAEETCPTTQKKHYQAFAYAHDKMKLTGWKKLFPTAHIEEMRGSFSDNEKYCSKEGMLTELGVRPAQGQRNDLIAIKRAIDSGKRPMEIADEQEEHFGAVMKYNTNLEKYFQYKRAKICQDDRTAPDVYVRIGPPGSGKTRWLDDTFGTSGYAIAPDNTGHWFDGCDCDVILFDDVEAGSIPPFSLWKRLCDRYPFKVSVKGGFITWKPKSIIFTSNQLPEQWWPKLFETDPFARQAFDRRVKDKIEFVSI